MSTYLELCQKAARESGAIPSGPTTVTGQTGRLQKVVGWVADAWIEIQNKHNAWQWLRAEFSGSITASTARYTGVSFSLTRFSRWIVGLDRDALTLYDTALGVADEGALSYIEWEDWRRRYGRGAQTENRPTDYAISPASELCFGPVPNGAYTVRGEYMKSPQTLSADGDTPECPAEFHDVIVWLACRRLQDHDEGMMMSALAMRNADEYLASLERNKLPRIRLAGPLA